MTWRVTAALSGLTVVATWVASHAPAGGPRDRTVAPSQAYSESTAVEIQREAERLHSRLQQVGAYKVPTRNPFRFGTRTAHAPMPQRSAIGEVVRSADVAPQPPTLLVRLSGIAEDVQGTDVVRTAIISTPDDVHVLKVGDTLGDVYKVTSIAADAVELTRLDDGSTINLTLRP